MKKIKMSWLVAIMVAMSMMATGCGESSVSSNAGNQSEGAENVASDTSAASSESTSEVKDETTSVEVTVEEKVLVDQDDVKITATSLEDGLFGTELKLLVENNSDKGLTFQARNASVNGYMVDTMMSEDVAAGKKANTSLTFSTSGLKDCGIDVIADMQFYFHIFTSDSWDDYLDTDMINIETSAAGSYSQVYDDSGEVFYDQDGIKIVGKGLSAKDSFFGPGLIVYIENNSSKDFTVQVRDTSVNGFMVDTSMSQDVVVGKKAITAVTFFSSSLEENGITDITSVETSFHIFDMQNWDTIADTEAITVEF